MSKWSDRSGLYKATLLFMYFIFLVYGLAFAIPTWWNVVPAFIPSLATQFQGLWVRCIGASDSADFSNCFKHAFGDDSAWGDGVRGVWIGGMFFYVVAVLYSLVENCCSDEYSTDYGVTGILALLAGLCGAAGVIVVAIEVEMSEISEYYWGYMLACITSGLTLILAVILLITRNVGSRDKASSADRTADYVYNHKPQPGYHADFTNHGYVHDNIPLTNGVTYHHTPASQPYHSTAVVASHPYTPYQDGGYYNGRPAPRHHPADLNTSYTDLSNGYTSELVHAEHSLSRTNASHRGELLPGAPDYSGRNDYFMNGSRPY